MTEPGLTFMGYPARIVIELKMIGGQTLHVPIDNTVKFEPDALNGKFNKLTILVGEEMATTLNSAIFEARQHGVY